MGVKIDINYLIGTRNGSNIMICEDIPKIYNNKEYRMIKVQCDCGNIHSMRLNDFMNRRFTGKKCHCHVPSGRRKANEPEFQIYYGIIQRCYNKNHPHYDKYGGRGIGIDDEWLGFHGYDNFKKDMGPRPSIKHSIDRIDVNGNYGPNNCRWALPDVQGKNKRNRRMEYYPGFKKDRLLILEELEPVKMNGGTKRYLRVQCDCGVIKGIPLLSLDVISSCGCYNIEVCEIKHVIYNEGDIINNYTIIREATIQEIKEDKKDPKRRYYWCKVKDKQRLIRVDRLRVLEGFKRTPKVIVENKKREFKLYRTIYKNHYGVELRKGYVIHHIDGNNKNNNIENLIEIPKYSHKWIHKKCNRHLIGMDKKKLKKELIKNFEGIVL
jgi:hypothetical protein